MSVDGIRTEIDALNTEIKNLQAKRTELTESVEEIQRLGILLDEQMENLAASSRVLEGGNNAD